MNLTLHRMTLENFKGVRELTVDFLERTRICGRNGSGKSTIADAFCWALFDKDANGKAPGTPDFRLKPLDEHGEEMHNLDTSVTLACTLDGAPLTFKRTQRENWVKKRGSAQATLSGNTSTYWVNGVETKLAGYKAEIERIAPLDVLWTLCRAQAFNALDWRARRGILVGMTGADVDGALLAGEDYAPLARDMAERGLTLEAYRKMLADQRKLTNRELQAFPVRIDEAQRSLTDITDQQAKDARYYADDARESIARIDAQLAALETDGGKRELAERLRKAQDRLDAVRREALAALTDARAAAHTRAGIARRDSEAADKLLQDTQHALELAQKRLAQATAERDGLRQRYGAVYERAFDPGALGDLAVCPSCGQALPEERRQALVSSARERFLAGKREELNRIRARGREASAGVERLEQAAALYKDQALAAQARAGDARQALEEAAAALAALGNAAPQEPPEAARLEAEIEELKRRLAQPEDEHAAALKARRAELEEMAQRNQAIIARHAAGEAVKERIEQLKRAQLEAADRVAALERMAMLAERFVRERCAALEESIDALFDGVHWRLFSTQINGGVADACECCIPCPTGMVDYKGANDGAKVNADIAIVNALSRHYGVTVPLFVDNAESVNRLARTECQLIALAVTEDEALTVTCQKEEREAA